MMTQGLLEVRLTTSVSVRSAEKAEPRVSSHSEVRRMGHVLSMFLKAGTTEPSPVLKCWIAISIELAAR
eukprot:scaffold116426_cov63-Attheya_sp.AAC.1